MSEENGMSEYLFKTCMKMAEDDKDEDFCRTVKKLADKNANPDHVMSQMAKRFDEDQLKIAIKEME